MFTINIFIIQDSASFSIYHFTQEVLPFLDHPPFRKLRLSGIFLFFRVALRISIAVAVAQFQGDAGKKIS